MPRAPLRDAEPRLLAAGLRLFSRLGCERVNSNAIAREASLGVGTFYAHFADKYALLRSLQLRTLDGLGVARRSALADAGRDPRDQVQSAAFAAVSFAERHADAYRVTFGRERAASAARGPVLTESSRPLAQALASLQATSQLDPALDVALAARAYLAMEAGTLLWWLEDSARARRSEIVDTLARLHPVAMAGRPSPVIGAQGAV